MANQQQLLQELFILATGRPANTPNLIALEAVVGPDGNLHALDGIINNYMDAQQAQLGTVGIVRAVARHALGREITVAQADQAANDLQAAGLDTWAKIFHWLANDERELTTTLDQRGEAAAHFTTQLKIDGKYDLFEGQVTWSAATNLIQSIDSSAQSLQNAKDALSSLSTAITADGIESLVIDGYVAGATVIADANANGVLDWSDNNGDGKWNPGEGEWFTITDAAGNYTLAHKAPLGTIIASGGTDLLTNKPFQGVLTAPAGSAVVTPLTTLVQALVDSGQSVNAAQAAVTNGLGLPADVNPLSYDPMKIFTDSNASDAEQARALEVQSTALQVANVITQAANAINAGSGSSSSLVDAGKTVADAIAAAVKAAADTGSKVDLANILTLTSIVSSASTGVMLSPSFVSQVASITSASNNAANSATTITGLSQAAVVSQGDATQAIVNGASSGNLNQAVSNFTGTNLNNAVNSASTGFIAPGVPVPTPTPSPDPAPAPTPIFTVSDTGGVVTFGGTATGAITVEFEDGGIATFKRDGLPATTIVPDYDTKTIMLAAGQELVVDIADSYYVATAVAYEGAGTLSGEVLFGHYATILDRANLDVALSIAGSSSEITEGPSFPTGNVDVRVLDATSVDQLDIIAHDWRTVTPTAVWDSYDKVNDSHWASIKVDLTLANSEVSVAQVNALDSAWGELTLGHGSVVHDTLANLLVASSATWASADAYIIVSTHATYAQLSTLDEVWGSVTAMSIEGAARDIAASSYVGNGTAVKLTDSAVLASDLVAIGMDTGINIDATSVTHITGTATDIRSVYAGQFNGLDDESLTVTGSTQAADVNTILEATAGPVSLTLDINYINGGSFAVNAGDGIGLDPTGTSNTLQRNPQAVLNYVEATGDWHFNASNGVFTWVDLETMARKSMTLTGIDAIEVYATGIRVPATQFTVLGTTTLVLSGGSGDITMTHDTDSATFTFTNGATSHTVPSTGVTSIDVPLARTLEGHADHLDVVDVLPGNLRITGPSPLDASVLQSVLSKSYGDIIATPTAISGNAYDVENIAYSIQLPDNYDVTLTGAARATSLMNIRDSTSGTIDGRGLTSIMDSMEYLMTALQDINLQLPDNNTWQAIIVHTASLADIVDLMSNYTTNVDLSGATFLQVDTSADITGLSGPSAATFDLQGGNGITLTLNAAQAAAATFINVGDSTINVVDTSDGIQSNLDGLAANSADIDSIDSSEDATAIVMDVTKFANLHPLLNAGDTIHVVQASSFLAFYFSVLKNAADKLDLINSTQDEVPIIMDLNYFSVLGSKLDAGDTVHFRDTSANIKAALGDLVAHVANVDAIMSSEPTVAIDMDVAQFVTLGGKLDAVDTIHVSDTAANIRANLAALASNADKLDVLDSTSSGSGISYTFEQFIALEHALLTSDTIVLEDAPGNLNGKSLGLSDKLDYVLDRAVPTFGAEVPYEEVDAPGEWAFEQDSGALSWWSGDADTGQTVTITLSGQVGSVTANENFLSLEYGAYP